MEELGSSSYSVRFVNARDEKIGGLELEPLRSLPNSRFFSILRGELARALYVRTELIFADTVTCIEKRKSDR